MQDHRGTSGLLGTDNGAIPGDTPDNQVYLECGCMETSTPYNVGDIVIPTTPNGHFYRC